MHSHPFLNPSLFVKPLVPFQSDSVKCRSASPISFPSRETLPKKYPSSLSKDPLRIRPSLCNENATSKKLNDFKRAPLLDITNLRYDDTCLGSTGLHREIPSIRSASSHAGIRTSTKALLTGPLGSISYRSSTPGLTTDRGTSSLTAMSESHQVSAKTGSCAPRLQQSPLHTRPKRVLSEPAGTSEVPHTARPVLYSRLSSAPLPGIFSKATSSTARAPSGGRNLLADNADGFEATLHHDSKPSGIALSTRLLKPQTYKVSYGQLVVLPSGGLLVDFREGERRKGRSGKEVLVTSADGYNVRTPLESASLY